MSQNDNTANLNLDSSKSSARPSHEALEPTEPTKLDQSAMDSAKRAENRIHADEETTPGNSIFSK